MVIAFLHKLVKNHQVFKVRCQNFPIEALQIGLMLKHAQKMT